MIRVDEGPSDSSSEAEVRGNDHEPMLYCPVCSLRLNERKCKLVCERCGYYNQPAPTIINLPRTRSFQGSSLEADAEPPPSV